MQKATRLTARIRESFQVDLKPSAIFLQPVLHAQATEISAAMDTQRYQRYPGIEAILDELDGMSDGEAKKILANENNNER